MISSSKQAILNGVRGQEKYTRKYLWCRQHKAFKMAETPTMKHAIHQSAIEAAKAALKVMSEAAETRGGTGHRYDTAAWDPKQVDLHYTELRNAEMEVNNFFLNIAITWVMLKKAPIIRNWPDREGLHFTQTITKVKQKACQTIRPIQDIQWKVQTPA